MHEVFVDGRIVAHDLRVESHALRLPNLYEILVLVVSDLMRDVDVGFSCEWHKNSTYNLMLLEKVCHCWRDEIARAEALRVL